MVVWEKTLVLQSINERSRTFFGPVVSEENHRNVLDVIKGPSGRTAAANVDEFTCCCSGIPFAFLEDSVRFEGEKVTAPWTFRPAGRALLLFRNDDSPRG